MSIPMIKISPVPSRPTAQKTNWTRGAVIRDRRLIRKSFLPNATLLEAYGGVEISLAESSDMEAVFITYKVSLSFLGVDVIDGWSN